MIAPDPASRYTQNVQASLQHVRDLLGKHNLLEQVSHNASLAREDRHALIDELVHTRHLGQLRTKLHAMHPADIAYILGALPLDQRLKIWNLVKADCGGEILIEVSEPVRVSLISPLTAEELRAIVVKLAPDKIADLAPVLPQQVIRDVFKSLAIERREQLRLAMSYREGTVGALMDFNMIRVRGDVALRVVSRYLRRLDAYPDHTDLLYVTDREDRFQGVLPLCQIITNASHVTVASLMITDTLQLQPEQSTTEVAYLFQRYDLASMPVVDENKKLLGRVTINAVYELELACARHASLNQAGLRSEEDVYAPFWNSVRNRWAGLALSLCAALLVSHTIANFEESIAEFVALASLVPIVTLIAGNSVMQTAALANLLAPAQVSGQLLLKELALGTLHGLMWGGAAGLLTLLFYRNTVLGSLVGAAILLNQIVAVLAGIILPLLAHRLGRTSTIGMNMLFIAITYSSGVFIFLELAKIFLIR